MLVIASNSFLEDLAMVLCVAALTTVIFQAIRQPVVVGYLIAGLIVGPHVPIPLLADQARIHTLSELGVILLMFALGLEFSVRRMVRLGPTSGFISALQVGLMVWLGYVCGQLMGWTRLESVFTGALLSISSTTIVAKVFEESPVPEKLRELVLGVLLTEDLIAVMELAILTALASGSEVSAQMISVTVARLVLFLVAMVGVGWVVVPRLIRIVARFERAETLLVASIGICFAFAIIAEHAGYSVALGAFLAGSLVAESGEGHKVEALVIPVRDMFAAVFFVSVGMMLDPELLAQHWVALVVMAAAVTFGKIFGVTIGALLAGYGPTLSIEAGMSLAQIGEFSFIIAGLGVEMKVAGQFLYSLAIAVSVITTFATPFLIRASAPVATAVTRRIPHALGVFDAVYNSAVETIRARAASETQRATVRRSAVLMLSGAVLLAGTVIVADLYLRPLSQFVSRATALSPEWAQVAVAALALFACAIPAVDLYFATRRLASILAARAIGPRADEQAPQPQREALIEMIQTAILSAVTVVLLAIVQPFLEPVDGVIVLVLAAGAVCYVTWRSLRRTMGQMGDAARLLVGALTRTAPAEFAALAPMRLESGNPAIGRTVGELDLEASTGAVIAAIARGRDNFVVPDADEVLRAGDVLGLAGPREATSAAIRMLAATDAKKASAGAPRFD